MERHIEDLVANPQRHFDNPRDVLAAGDLALDVKRRILESWKLDAARLAESTAENMAGGEESDLRAVSKSLSELKLMEDAAPVAKRGFRRLRRPGLAAGLLLGGVVGAGIGVLFLTAAGWASPVLLLVETTVIGALVGGLAAVVRRSWSSGVQEPAR